MSLASCNPCACPSSEIVEVPGPPGTDATPVAPDVVDPEGVKVGTPGQTYLNSNTETFWVKKSGSGNTGWIQIVGAVATIMFLLCSAIQSVAQPVLRNVTTTNTTPTVLNLISNAAVGKIAVDTTKQPANLVLTNLASGNGVNLSSNVPPSALSGTKFTGVITNRSTLMTNWIYVTNGIIISISTFP